MLCHCRGDIDDCEMDGTEEQLMCEHCDDNDRPYDDDPTEIEDNRQFREALSPNARAEWCRGSHIRMQTGTRIRHPLQHDSYANAFYFLGRFR
jgi:hypothetical protein